MSFVAGLTAFERRNCTPLNAPRPATGSDKNECHARTLLEALVCEVRALSACAVLALAVFAWVPTAWALPADDAVRALLEARIAKLQGVAFAVVLHDAQGTRIVTAGPRSVGGPAVDAHTLFEIGSITKTFTALLLAEAVVRGERRLDDPVAPLFPWPAPALEDRDAAVTLRQLATHTSGLPRIPPNLWLAAILSPSDPYADYGAEKLRSALSWPWRYGRSGAYEYSNFGAGVLGFALTASAGGYNRVLRERVLAPLGMSTTGVAPAGERATGHASGLTATPAWNFDALAGAGALWSTPQDMGRYLLALLAPDSTSLGKAVRLVLTPQANVSERTKIALAWHLTERRGRTIAWHNGRTGGFASMLAFDAQRGEGVVVLGNASIVVDDLAFHLLDARPAAD